MPSSSEAGRHGRDTEPHSSSRQGTVGGCTASSCSSPEHTNQALVSGTTTSSQTTRLAEQSLQLWKGHVSLARLQGQGGAVSPCPLRRGDAKPMSSTGLCDSGWSRCGGELKDCCMQPGPAQEGRELGDGAGCAWPGTGCAITSQSCTFCVARPHSPSLPRGPRSGEITAALPRSMLAWRPARVGGCACSPGGEAGWRAPKSYLQPGACTRVIPAGQGAGESSQTPEPAWFCRCRAGCKPQLPQLCGPGHGHSGCAGGTEPRSPPGGTLTSGTAAAMLCTVPSTQWREEGSG